MIYEEKNEEPIRHLLFHNQGHKRTTVDHVIIFLCGTGQKGANINELFETGLPKVLRDNPAFELPNTFVMCCQIPSSGSWVWNDDELMRKLFDYVRSHFLGAKIHLTGLSLGGQGVLYACTRHIVHSIGVMAGFVWDITGMVHSIYLVPSYFVHGSNDTVVNKSVPDSIIPSLRRLNADCTYHERDAGHNVWNWAYDIDNPQGYLQWFRDKFIENDNTPPDEEKEYIPVEMDSLELGDTVISPTDVEYVISRITEDNLIIAIKGDVVNDGWKARNPNYKP